VILHAVFFYLRYGVSHRDLEEILAERGVMVDHATLNRLVVRYASGLATVAQRRKATTAPSWRLDETYVKVRGECHRFPPQIIAHVVWLYARFNLSLREVEELMLERGVDVSYETTRRWTVKFGPLIAHVLRRRQPRPGDVWHLDEVVVKIASRSYWLWRAVDQHGFVIEEILQSRRNKRAA